MQHPELERFGSFVISQLWDSALEHHDLLAKAHWRAPALQNLQDELAALSEKQKEIVRRCVAEALRDGLHDFLFALQEAHDLKTGIEVLVDGKNIAELSDGLQGEPYGSEGWIAKYGKHQDNEEQPS
jgi:hypothetical protein